MTNVICLAGPAGPDLEALTAGLRQRLSARGLRVGLIRRGDDQALALAAGGLLLELPRPAAMSVEEMAERYLDETDLVLCHVHEGVKRPKLEYAPQGGRPALADDPGLKALIGPGPAPSGVALFAPDRLDDLADHIVENLTPKGEPVRARVFVGGKRVPMKDFVQDIVAGTVRAMIGSLRGGQRQGRLTVIVED